MNRSNGQRRVRKETDVTPDSDEVMVTAVSLTHAVAHIFEGLGYSTAASHAVAENLVAADQRGVHSHGVRLVPTYVSRILAGTISHHESAVVVVDNGATAVLDARDAPGQLTADQAMSLTIDKAKTFGVGAVAVRQACHFGAASRYVLDAAAHGCIGIAVATTSVLMAAWGGAEPIVGNNPLAIGVPSADGIPFVLDMALSEGALGKIQIAAAKSEQIPSTWATSSEGVPTTDAAAALAGLLLPTGGPKGLGLAMAIDILAGVLSGGGWGKIVRPLFTETESPNNCSHFFLALDISSFRDLGDFSANVATMAAGIRGSKRAPGIDRLYSPGEPEWVRQQARQSEPFALDGSIAAAVVAAGQAAGVDVKITDP
jgi:LDH2 family malate/lactate/ureidoglycolate dehydrogenase